MDRSNVPPSRVVVLAGIALEGVLGALAWGLGYAIDRSPLDDFQPTVLGALLGVSATGPLLLLFVWTDRSQLPGLVRIRRVFAEVLEPLFVDCSLLDLALISVAAGLGEELLFRGVVQVYLARHLGLYAGLALASVLFGLVHPITPTYIALASLMGLYLGLLMIATGNLMVAVVAHALYDFLVLAFVIHVRARRRRSARPMPDAGPG